MSGQVLRLMLLSMAFVVGGHVIACGSGPTTQGTVTPLLVEDFSTYNNVSELLADPRGIWANGEAFNTSRISFDRNVGYERSDRSMRYDWPNNGAACLDYQISPGRLQIPGGLTHVWIEYVVRFSPNFRVDAQASGCAAEYKLATLGEPSGIGRWNIPEMQAGQWVFGYPGNEAGFVSGVPVPTTLWDGRPHVFRIEARLGKSNEGVLRFWIDGVLLRAVTGFRSDDSHAEISWFTPGANINQGPNVSGMQLWWHRIVVYEKDPGW